MSHQIRPGARGGRDQFSWDQVKEDKQRINYLGSSIHGIPDKFKKGPETFWYAKETKTIPPKASEKSEIELIKEKEKQMMEALLGGRSNKNETTVEKRVEKTCYQISGSNRPREYEERSRRERSPARRERSPARRDYYKRDKSPNYREYSRSDRRHYDRRSRSRSPRRNLYK